MIVDWLKQVGLEQHAAAFEANGLDIDVLPDLKEADLEHLGLSLGDRKRALRAIAAMGDKTPRAPLGTLRAPLGTLGSTHPAVHEPHALRRQLSVMFCDVVGSTSLSAKLDPEDYELAIRTIQDACKTEILPRGGIIGQYHGDGVMAYFGYPQAHEDDAERAVRAGLAIVARIEEMRLASGDKPLVRLAVATGIVVIGEGAGSGPGHQQVFGETPNLAARLQNLAEPNALIIAGSTRRLLGELFVCKDLGLRDITGLPTPVSVWQVVAERKVETRFEARRVNHLTSFVGRTAELQKLSELWGLARSGSGQIALLCGEAGIGKSRVTSAFSQTIADQPHRVIRYQCSPHHTNSPFYPVIAQIERAAGLEAGDPANVKLDKLEALMRPDVAALSDMPLFAALLSIPFGSRYPDLHLTPQRQKDRTITAILSFLRGVSQAAPTLVLFEDIHWIDPSTLELVNRCIEAMHGMSCMLLATFRPEFYPLWLDQPHVTMLTLNRLRRDDTAAMLAHITRGKALPRDVYDQILSKTDGIPLFVEELTRAVIETGLLQEDNDRFVPLMPLQALTIPMTLQDSLMARLDRLAPVREIAQIGAALGREFSYRLIAAVAELPDMRLKEALAQLTAAELIFGRGAPPELDLHLQTRPGAGCGL